MSAQEHFEKREKIQTLREILGWPEPKPELRQCEHADVPRSQCGCPESGPCQVDPDTE